MRSTQFEAVVELNPSDELSMGFQYGFLYFMIRNEIANIQNFNYFRIFAFAIPPLPHESFRVVYCQKQ